MKIITIIFIVDLIINFLYLLINKPDLRFKVKIETNSIFQFIAKMIYAFMFSIFFTTFILTCVWIYGLLKYIFNNF